MWRRNVTLFILIFTFKLVYGECPTIIYEVTDTACYNENITIQDVSVNVDSYYWDFCIGDYESEPIYSDLSTIANISTSWGYRIYEDNGLWFGFASSKNNSSFLRFEYGNSPDNQPVITNFGNPGNLLNYPEGFDLIKFNGNWYAFIGYQYNGGQLTRLDFGNSLTNTPSATNIGSFVPGRIRDLRLLVQDDNLILVFPYYNGNSIYRINYRDSVNNIIEAQHIFIDPVAGANLPTGLEITNVCDNWYAHMVSLVNNSVQQINFGNDILSSPVVEWTRTFNSVQKPYRISIVREGQKFFAAISNESLPVALIDLKDLDPLTEPSELDNSSFPTITNVMNIDHKGRKIIQGISGTILKTLEFRGECGQNIDYSFIKNPQGIKYSLVGNHIISLKAFHENGNFDVLTDTIFVKPDTVPDLSLISNGNSCIDNFTDFKGESPDNITFWNWDFGDSTFASIQNPAHQYTNPGTYPVKLSVEAENGCSNYITKNISIYNPPIPFFNITGTLLCTNNSIILENSSSYTSPDSITSFIWNIDNEAIAYSKDTSYVFTTNGNKNISLTASIPGCSPDTSVVISVVNGPLSSFSLENVCDQEIVEFINESSGNITSYLWNFGDSTASNLESPSHLYDSSDEYPVSLSVTNEAGCINMASKDVVVHAIPEADFSNEQACHLADVQFNDITTVQRANITKWNWNYKSLLDETIQGSDTIKNPLLNFPEYGDYHVSLEAESNYGCIDSMGYIIYVLPSPEANFSNTISCLGDSTFFSDISTIDGGNIIQDWIWEIDEEMYYTADPNHFFDAPGDYQAMLAVRADNLCEGRITKMILINPLPQADFMNHNNCLNETILLQSTTVSQEDPVSLYRWEIDNGDYLSGYQVGIRFDSARDYSVKHIVTTNLGCSDSTTKIISINNPPTAIFSSLPDFGAPPLKVRFENKSLGADNIIWYFNDGTGSVSNEINPEYTYTYIGEYYPALVTFNDKGCKDSITTEINIVEPVMDVSLNNITEVLINNKRKYILNISNPGTILVDDMEIIININGQYVVTEDFQEKIIANESINYTLNFELLDVPGQDLQFLCIELKPRSLTYEDKNPLDNQECLTTNEKFVVLDPYPNPVSDDLFLDLLLPEKEDLSIRMVSSSGKVQWHRKITHTKKGLNKIIIQMDVVPSGVYILNIAYKGSLINRQVVVNN